MPGLSRNAAGTTAIAGDRNAANSRTGAKRSQAHPAPAPPAAAAASGSPACRLPSGPSACNATAAASAPTSAPAARGRQSGASRPIDQSATQHAAGAARQSSSTRPGSSAASVSWATKNSGLPRRTSKSGWATAMHHRPATCSASCDPRTEILTFMLRRGYARPPSGSVEGTMVQLRTHYGSGLRRLPQHLLVLALLLPGAWPAAAAQPPAAAGIVLDGETNLPVPGAEIRTASATATAGPDGRFTIALPAGGTTLRVAAPGYLDNTVTPDPAALAAGAELQILLFRNTFAETVRVTPPVQAPERPSATPIAAAEVLEVAGAIDNVFRTLDTLPGVASTGDFGSRLAVRGGTPDQNLTVMDGVEIHNPYRLFGLVSAFNPETVDRFELTAGGFGAAWGDRLSSILVVDNRAGRPAFQGSGSASFTDGNVVVEGAAPGGGSWLVTGRRTYYDPGGQPGVGPGLPVVRRRAGAGRLGVRAGASPCRCSG